jgi:hypothetical protein
MDDVLGEQRDIGLSYYGKTADFHTVIHHLEDLD